MLLHYIIKMVTQLIHIYTTFLYPKLFKTEANFVTTGEPYLKLVQ